MTLQELKEEAREYNIAKGSNYNEEEYIFISKSMAEFINSIILKVDPYEDLENGNREHRESMNEELIEDKYFN